jgi:anoctamin-10/anoctamin-7
LLRFPRAGLFFLFPYLLSDEPYRSQFTVLPPVNVELGGLIPAVLQSVSIAVFSATWKFVSLQLTVFENHRTDTAFEDSLIVKTFSFEFVNKYAACFYAAFAKKYFVSGESCDPSCFDELATTLGTLFVVELAVGNAGEVWGAFAAKKKREVAESVGVAPDRNMSQVEKQYTAETFDKMLGTFRNYQEMAFQFGYATLFSAAFPLAPVLSYLNNFVEIRVDGWKLLQCSRRPEPSGCEDIGAWYGILDLISTISVVTNGLLIFFVATSYEDVAWTHRFTLFLVFEHVLLAAKLSAAALIPDQSRSTEIQGARQLFIASKVIENAPDDEPEFGAEKEAEGGFDILDGDDDPMF